MRGTTNGGRKPSVGSASGDAIARRFQAALAAAQSGRRDDAISLLRALLQRAPTHRPARNVMGAMLLDGGQVAEAIDVLRALARETPEVSAVQVNLGNALVAAGHVAEAREAMERAVRREPDHAGNWYGLGRVLQLAGDVPDAVSAYEQVLRRDPDHVLARSNLAAALNFLDRFADGEREARLAVQRDPADAGAHFNLGVALLSQGHWAEGWQEFEWRDRAGLLGSAQPRHASPVWNGALVPGATLVVYAEQGFGDTLQYVRYLPRLRAAGVRIVLMVQRPLVRLLHANRVADVVLPLGASVPAHDAHVSLSSLPFRMALHSDEAVCVSDAPYLVGAPESPRRPEHALRVGLVWAGHPTHVNDRHRSCGLPALATLLDVPGVEWLSLQVGPRAIDRAHADVLHRLPDGTATLRDFADTARVVAALDLVITVDSAMAHLAGALGTPTWMLLPRVGLDWRWTIGGLPTPWQVTPWYRTVACVRQEQIGDWRSVVDAVAGRLTAIACGAVSRAEALPAVR